LQMVCRGDVGKWWAAGCVVVAVVWAAIRWHKVGRWVWAKKPEPSH
jgi:hypothetical protein